MALLMPILADTEINREKSRFSECVTVLKLEPALLEPSQDEMEDSTIYLYPVKRELNSQILVEHEKILKLREEFWTREKLKEHLTCLKDFEPKVAEDILEAIFLGRSGINTGQTQDGRLGGLLYVIRASYSLRVSKVSSYRQLRQIHWKIA